MLLDGAVKLPRTIHQYEFVELLGAGSFGHVYRAVLRGALGFEQEVAIKALDSIRARLDPDLVASLANEARILSRVQHPNVVQVRHFVAVDDEALGDTWILVMELVRGQSLRTLTRWDRESDRPLPLQAPLQILSEIADGLHFAHRLTDGKGARVGLVHRDLKPDNIHVTNEGRIKILDFGIAWAKRRLGARTGGGLTKGTPLYMSPEQLRGDPLDGRSDLYALGVIGFELLAGRPYVPMVRAPGVSPLQIARQTRFSQREELLRGGLDARYGLSGSRADPLVELLRELLAQQREHRPQTGGEVFDRLEDLTELHRPSRGRGHLRRWVEAWNQREAQQAEGEPPIVASTVVLRADTTQPDTRDDPEARTEP